jgi:hypothetical protein
MIIHVWLLFPVVAQIHPARIRLLNQRNFPATMPSLELFFTCDGVVNIAKVLKRNNTLQAIAFCKPLLVAMAMLVQTALNVICDSDIQRRAMFVRENVHPVVVVAYLSQKRSEMFRFAQHDKFKPSVH